MTIRATVSIVMPTYNGTKYLDDAIQSCLDQTYPAWELVIVDDASTDNTARRLEYWQQQDNRIRVIRHETNKKLPGALNTGIRHMKGSYYTWLSDDDLLRPHALETMVNFMQQNPDVDLLHTDYSEVDENMAFLQRIVVESPDLLGIGNPIGVCHLRKREVFDKVGLYAEDLFLAEDLDFWIRAYMHCKIATLHEDLFLYRQHGGSLTTRQKRRVYPVHAEILDRHIDGMSWLNADGRAWAYIRLAKLAFKYRDARNFLKYTEQSLTQSPTFLIRKFIQKLLHNNPENDLYLSTETARHENL